MSVTRRMVGVVLLLVALVTAACGGDEEDPKPLPAPQTLLATGAAEVQNAQSFELEMNVDGYPVEIEPTGFTLPDELPLQFKYAHGVYEAPDRVQARIEFSVGDISTTAELIAVDRDQYFSGDFLTAKQWVNGELIQGFTPAGLMSSDTGIPGALSSVADLEMVGETDLDGVAMLHLTGTIQADAVHSLTFGLIRSSLGLLGIEIYLSANDRRIAQITLLEPPPAEAPEADPTTWTIKISNYNEDVSITAPDVTGGQ